MTNTRKLQAAIGSIYKKEQTRSTKRTRNWDSDLLNK
jgi:hypothetical protein